MGRNRRCIDLSVFLWHRILNLSNVELPCWLSVKRDWTRNIWKLPVGVSDIWHDWWMWGSSTWFYGTESLVHREGWKVGFNFAVLVVKEWWAFSKWHEFVVRKRRIWKSTSPLHVNWFLLPATLNIHISAGKCWVLPWTTEWENWNMIWVKSGTLTTLTEKGEAGGRNTSFTVY